MNASEFVPDPRWRDRRKRHVDPATASATMKPPDRKRPGCRDVARSRAGRYARRRRILRLLLPLIAAFILIGLAFERHLLPAFSSTEGKAAPDGGRVPLASMPEPDGEQNIDRLPNPDDADSTAGGIPETRHRPPTDFLATDKDVAQIVAFLVRNRDRLDNEAVRAKWTILDRASLPLAILLREIEATAAWDDLEKEIAAAPPGTPAASRSGLPKSIRHRKLLRLMPEWARRGEDLLAGGSAADASSDDAPTPDGDDGPDTRPRKS